MEGNRGGQDATLREVVDRAEKGDDQAFGEIYRVFRRRIFGLCLHIVGAPEDAEDATAEVFMRVRAALKRYDRSVPLGAWLTKIATNLCLDKLRRRRREARLFSSDRAEEAGEASAPDPSPLAEVLAEEAREHLAAAIAALPDRYRVPLALRYYAEMSYDEIGERLGQTRQEVATSLFRAKKRLRLSLSRQTGAP